MKNTQALQNLGWDFIETIEEQGMDLLENTIDEEWAVQAHAMENGNTRYLIFEEGQLADEMQSSNILEPARAYEILRESLDEE